MGSGCLNWSVREMSDIELSVDSRRSGRGNPSRNLLCTRRSAYSLGIVSTTFQNAGLGCQQNALTRQIRVVFQQIVLVTDRIRTVSGRGVLSKDSENDPTGRTPIGAGSRQGAAIPLNFPRLWIPAAASSISEEIQRLAKGGLRIMTTEIQAQ